VRKFGIMSGKDRLLESVLLEIIHIIKEHNNYSILLISANILTVRSKVGLYKRKNS